MAVRITGRARCTVASTTAWNGSSPSSFVVVDLPDQDQGVAHQDSRQRNQADQRIDAERLPEQEQGRHHADQPQGSWSGRP